MRTLFTSESVTEGHPDKICDQISDGILDALLAVDPNSRCACETTAEPGAVHIMGEITTAATVNYIEIARRIIREIGYTKPEYGFDADTCEISCSLHTQSADIAQGVDLALEAKEAIDTDGLGAGDQGMMFGYACDETPELMPLPITLAHRITRRLAAVRKSGELGYLRPDGKAQVTVEYENGKPVRVNTVVLSAQHDEDADADTLRRDMIEKVIKPCIPAEMLDAETKYFINPTGRFVLGGPAADTGLTGRKIIVDTYGGYARHGGGAFSGKDATKVDRSAAYMARNIDGLICPLFSAIWAVMGAVYYFLVDPYILRALDWLSRNLAFSFVIGAFFGVFAIDFVYSTQLMVKIRNFAREKNVVVRYEELKAYFKEGRARGRQHFFLSLHTEVPLREKLQQYYEYRRSRREELERILHDDGSTDGTVKAE